MDIEEINLGIDIVISLDISLDIVFNELISNSLKHAFPSGKGREISITLYRAEYLVSTENSCERETRRKKKIYPLC
ncbi:hypothetical protein MSBRW_3196 [Methanosarcina barkeri str. Wiesmoor]|uniref:Sensory transduction histidine kinase n=1 Tax=Methanosarcina barkeri str. Wiesmoor TaxID=1434109 RepID=A0A0E3QQF4_METBA|nr:hypothetical protein MSBRW_3196 [Methanosarcina barkeri str. Wiesmoor]